ncbi:MAG: hypothetical protein ABJK39_13765 [Hyphomicrobiales bacterium]
MKKERSFYILGLVVFLWVILPVTTQTTAYTGYLQIGRGYTPVADFRVHPNPPEIEGKTYFNLVWHHERYSVLWLPFAGSKKGQYGLYKRTTVGTGKRRRVSHSKSFKSVSVEKARELAATVNVKLPAGSPVSDWSLYFGWIVFLPFGFLLVTDRKTVAEWVS